MNRNEIQANEAFRSAGLDQPNFMTPHIVMRKVILKKRLAVELSTGTGFRHQPIWGVTVLEQSANGTWKGCGSLSKGGFQSRWEAEAYIDELETPLAG